MGHDALLYALGAGCSAVIGIASVAVLTRFLAPGAFGRLAVLIFFSEFLAVVYDLGILQGAMRVLFDPHAGVESDSEAATFQRQAMATSVLITAIAGLAGVALIAIWAPDVARLLLSDRRAAGLVRIATGTAALTAMMRLMANQLRYERRPAAYSTAYAARPFLSLAFAVPLLVRSADVRSVMLANLAGSAAAVGVAAILTRRLFSAPPSVRAAREVWRRGGAWAPVAFALWVMNTAGVFILSGFAAPQTVGIYRAAYSLGALASYMTGIFYMSWGPISRSSLYQAARRQIGLVTLNRSLATLYVAASSALVFTMAILEDELIRIAGARYRSAAPLIPLLALPFALYGLFRILYFTSTDPRRIKWFRGLSVGGSVCFVVIGSLTAGPLGPYGIVIAHATPFFAGAVLMFLLTRSAGASAPVDVRRCVLALGSGAACLIGDRLAVGLGLTPRIVPDAVATIALGLLLVAVNAVPRAYLRLLVGAVVGGTSADRAGQRSLEQRLPRLAPLDVVKLYELISGVDADDLSRRAGETTYSLLAWFTRTVRSVVGGGASTPVDDEIARYLLFDGSTAGRDAHARHLMSLDVDPLELERLRGAVGWLRRRSRRWWRMNAIAASEASQRQLERSTTSCS